MPARLPPRTPPQLSSQTSHNEQSPYLSSVEHVSPIKARAQDRLNQEISQITAWLESLLGPLSANSHFLKWREEVISQDGSARNTILGPGDQGAGITRNEVLDALQALRSANLRADELQRLLHVAREGDLKELRARNIQSQRDSSLSIGKADELLKKSLEGLSPEAKQALAKISAIAVILDIDLQSNNDQNVQDLVCERLIEYSAQRLVLSQQIDDLNSLNQAREPRVEARALADEKASKPLSGIEQDDYDHNSKLREETSQFTRDTKTLEAKIVEYTERILLLKKWYTDLPKSGYVSLQSVLDARARVVDREARIAGLKQRLTKFHGLPPDLKTSREEVKRAMIELDTLKKKRQDLFTNQI